MENDQSAHRGQRPVPETWPLAARRLPSRREVSSDGRAVFGEGDPAREGFYRDRWSHDKAVRSTHGVNCTGSCSCSCSWTVYVKDGTITWEHQATDYPSIGTDRPEYEPRGCPRGASFSWYTYSPGRVRYPYVRGELLKLWREARRRRGDPVAAWAEITGDPAGARAFSGAPLLFRLHALTACLLFAAWPFTRLVHVWSAPIGYLVRPYVVHRRRAAGGTPRPPEARSVGTDAAPGERCAA